MSFEFHFSDEALGRIFSFESVDSDRLISRENSRLEFKESFNLGSADEYAKTAAAFANTQGGYIVFGVKDSPRQMVGMKTSNFENFDAAKLTNALNERFSPEIHWESHIYTVRVTRSVSFSSLKHFRSPSCVPETADVSCKARSTTDTEDVAKLSDIQSCAGFLIKKERGSEISG